ncbi:nuclear transport factor 2 family protein [Robertkochia aurantiaca]|uniref:nuclear transport factor 2 family protein n=1 Tax=Robertkochia aurantiaca TaxID=2873700 RepID=UPI001CCE4A2E|nr:nuclear transport factor 2 family protein [Robertkochia sp. 3YJGBD-33]
MKKILSLIVCFGGFYLSQAQGSEKEQLIKVVDDFFIAFHKQDTSAIKEYVQPDMLLQTTGENEEGEVQLRSSSLSEFLTRLAAIPEVNAYEEKLLDYKVLIDGPMAQVWTPYEFWFDGQFSHCGVNSFQMVKLNGKWKIIYLIDTRRKEGCEGHDNK